MINNDDYFEIPTAKTKEESQLMDFASQDIPFSDADYSNMAYMNFGDNNCGVNEYEAYSQSNTPAPRTYQQQQNAQPVYNNQQRPAQNNQNGYTQNYNQANQNYANQQPRNYGYAQNNNQQNQGGEKIYLNVPFAEKDEAKSFGARWDAAARKWYVNQGTDLTPLKKWMR